MIESKDTLYTPSNASNLDLHLKSRQTKARLYDKRDNFTFPVEPPTSNC